MVFLKGFPTEGIAVELPVARVNGASTSFRKQLRDQRFDSARRRIAVVHLADLRVPDPPGLVDHVDRRPVVIAERVPVGGVVVDERGIRELVARPVSLDRVAIALARELGSVNAYHGDPLVLVLRGCPLDPGERAFAVDSAEGPDGENDDLAAQ